MMENICAVRTDPRTAQDNSTQVARFILGQFRRCETVKKVSRASVKEEGLEQFHQLWDDMLKNIGMQETCLARKELLHLMLPLSVHVFYFCTDDGTICSVGPFLTSACNRHALEYWLRGNGVATVDPVYAMFCTFPVLTQDQIEAMQKLLSGTLGMTSVTMDAVNYGTQKKQPSFVYELCEHAEKKQMAESAAEAADDLIGKIVMHFQSGNQRKLQESVSRFSELILKYRDHRDVLHLLRGYLQEEIAQITSSLFAKTRSRKCIQLMSAFMDQLTHLDNAEDLIREQREFLDQALKLTRTSKDDRGVVDRRVQELEEYIRAHFAQKLTLSQLAQRAGLSTSYLSGLFSRETGMTISNYIRKTRIEHAQLLLRYLTIPVTDIAYQCGYQDISYFIKEFRKETGCPPAEYRKRWRSLPDNADGIAI